MTTYPIPATVRDPDGSLRSALIGAAHYDETVRISPENEETVKGAVYRVVLKNSNTAVMEHDRLEKNVADDKLVVERTTWAALLRTLVDEMD